MASDGSWYRAKVVKITVDDYDESQIESQVEFLDFGLSESKDLSELFSLKPEFLKLKFQSISACLAQVKPVEDNQWSNQALDDFETLTHSAQWKPICAQIVKYKIVGENEKCLPCLKLVDTNGEEVKF